MWHYEQSILVVKMVGTESELHPHEGVICQQHWAAITRTADRIRDKSGVKILQPNGDAAFHFGFHLLSTDSSEGVRWALVLDPAEI